jgi:hypothetical protein
LNGGLAGNGRNSERAIPDTADCMVRMAESAIRRPASAIPADSSNILLHNPAILSPTSAG